MIYKSDKIWYIIKLDKTAKQTADWSNAVEKSKKGATDKYTVVMWLEGEDPQCVNDLFGGKLTVEYDFNVVSARKK